MGNTTHKPGKNQLDCSMICLQSKFEPSSKKKMNSCCSEEWLKRMDQRMTYIKPIMQSTYGNDSATKWTAYWRTFFIAVAELFGYNNGEEWMVAHFLFKKK